MGGTFLTSSTICNKRYNCTHQPTRKILILDALPTYEYLNREKDQRRRVFTYGYPLDQRKHTDHH